MTLEDYIRSSRSTAKPIKSDIVERWNNRIRARGLDRMGKAGAQSYLSDYGRGIAAPKCISLAIKAEQEGAPDMALGFWERAYQLSGASNGNGSAPAPKPAAAPVNGKAGTGKSAPKPAAPVAPKPIAKLITDFPSHLQPGSVSTMQPSDAKLPQSHYVLCADYWGQPKRDGHRIVVFGTRDEAHYQARSTTVSGTPHPRFDEAIKKVAAEVGPFVLDGEKTYLDANYGEHRSGAQAAQVNIELGKPTVLPIVTLAIFKALFADGVDLTTSTEAERIAAAIPIVDRLQMILDEELAEDCFFEMVPVAKSTAEKQDLCARQQIENREGEVWVRHSCRYTGGKNSSDEFVRTKYLTEHDVIITKLTKTTAAGRAFGAIEVAREENGKLVPMGSVGTGFDGVVGKEIADRHAATPGKVRITVRSQGLTENGKLWHARYVGFTA